MFTTTVRKSLVNYPTFLKKVSLTNAKKENKMPQNVGYRLNLDCVQFKKL